jgi:hypothetical protein
MSRRTPVNETVLDDWLAVSTDGFASMNAGRDPAHLVKELVQNAMDAIGESRGVVELTLTPGPEPNTVVVTCRDNGCGMSNLRDIRTVFYTSKTDSHLNRGRMGRGFKEMLCLAEKAVVISGGRRIEFCVEAGRRITKEQSANGSAQRGMLVTMQMPWPAELIAKLEAYFRTFLPPDNAQLVINGTAIVPRAAAHHIQTALPTELFEAGRWVRPIRSTAVQLVAVTDGEEPTVYEMGIPVCPAEWSVQFHLDILQRVPMNPCRDAVASGYLLKLHRSCLPILLPVMDSEQVRQDWVGAAVPHCDEQIQKEVIDRAFGQNIARSVPKMGARQFDEDARDLGVQVIDTKQTSGGFREVLQQHVPTSKEIVDQHNDNLVAAAASTKFSLDDVDHGDERLVSRRRELIEAAGGRERVQQVMEFARWFCQKLLDGYEDAAVCSVALAMLKPVNAIATWSQDDVLTLGLDTPWLWTDPLGEEALSLFLHEVAHAQNAHHGRDFHREIEKLAGRAARIMLIWAGHIAHEYAALLEQSR